MQPLAKVTLEPNQLTTLVTGWTAACSPVTPGTSIGWDTRFDKLVLDPE